MADEQRPSLHLPRPPRDLVEHWDARYAPAPAVSEWVQSTFITRGAPLYNEDHLHLTGAHVAFLWTNEENVKRGRRILGTAQLGEPQGSNVWGKGRQRVQLEAWFGTVPDFLITLDAVWVDEASDPAICALIEHELYHCAQQLDEFECPRFTKNGRPIWGMRAHDVEQFVGVVRRYGADAALVRELVDAAQAGPTVSPADVAGVCGSCMRRVA